MSMEKEIGAEEKTEGANASVEEKKERREAEKQRDEKITDFGQTVLNKEEPGKRIHLLSIIGEIEGHECSAQNMKTTKYEHVLPQLAAIEDDATIGGLLILLNTVGGDVEAGLAIAELISASQEVEEKAPEVKKELVLFVFLGYIIVIIVSNLILKKLYNLKERKNYY